MAKSSTVSELLTRVGYRLFPDGSTLSTSTEPTQAECLGWMQEACEELLRVYVETKSELGTTFIDISLVDGTSTYTNLQTLIFAPVEFRKENGDLFAGWIVKTNELVPLKLFRWENVIDYSPSQEKEPDGFYLTGDDQLVFVPTPDDSYTARIPYYVTLTSLSTEAGPGVTTTVPFLGVFDHVIVESIVLRAQNREEYDVGFELNWFKHLRDQARRLIALRRGTRTRIIV